MEPFRLISRGGRWSRQRILLRREGEDVGSERSVRAGGSPAVTTGKVDLCAAGDEHDLT